MHVIIISLVSSYNNIKEHSLCVIYIYIYERNKKKSVHIISY